MPNHIWVVERAGKKKWEIYVMFRYKYEAVIDFKYYAKNDTEHQYRVRKYIPEPEK